MTSGGPQQFNTVDVLKLELEVTPTGPINLLPNPDGLRGGWGWVTPVGGSTINTMASGSGLFYAAPVGAAQPNWWTTEPVPMTAGAYAAAAWTMPTASGGWVRASIEWLTAATQTLISATTPTAYAQASGAYTIPATVAPAGTGFMRLRFDLYATNAGGNPAPVTFSYFTDVVLASAATAGPLATGVPTLPRGQWVNVIGPTHTITINREKLNLGILDADVLDSAMDPAATTSLRPGRGVRVLELVGGVWESLFDGKSLTVSAEYDQKTQPIRPPRVRVMAVDATQKLAAVKRQEAVSTIDSLRYVLEGTGVPWNVNGSGAHAIAMPAVVGLNDKAVALEQVALTRDTTSGEAWVSRKGTLVAHDYHADPGLANPTFDVDAAGWAGSGATTLARVTTPVRSGAGALQLTKITSTGTAAAVTPSGTSAHKVVGGRQYAISAWFRSAAVARSAAVGVDWYSATGAAISIDTSSSVTTTTSSWTQATATFTAPAEAKYARARVEVGAGVPVSEVHYVDDVAFTVAAPLYTFDMSTYSDLQVGFSSDECVNSVNVELLVWDPAQASSESIMYGPYADATSVAEWGIRSAKFTVAGMDPAAIPAYAAAILARNATPRLAVRSITLPMRTTADRARSLVDVGDTVRVTHTGKGIDHTLKVAKVQHRIADEKWLLTLEFTQPTSVASPAPAPPQADPAPVVPEIEVSGVLGDWSGTIDSASHKSRARRDRKQVVVYIDLVQNAAMAGGTSLLLLPTSMQPPAGEPYFFYVLDRATAAPVAMYAELNGGNGFIKYVSARAAGSGVLGTVTFQVP